MYVLDSISLFLSLSLFLYHRFSYFLYNKNILRIYQMKKKSYENKIENCKLTNSYLQIALWLYAGPSVTESAWPTCVCVRPNDRRRNLNALANSFISSKSIPSTTLQFVWLIVGSSERFKNKYCFRTTTFNHGHISFIEPLLAFSSLL